MMSCQVSEKPKNGPATTHAMTTALHTKKVRGLLATCAILFENWTNRRSMDKVEVAHAAKRERRPDAPCVGRCARAFANILQKGRCACQGRLWRLFSSCPYRAALPLRDDARAASTLRPARVNARTSPNWSPS